MFSQAKIPKLQPLTVQEITSYLYSYLHSIPQRLAIIETGLCRNREMLLASPTASSQIIDGLFGDCPYVNREDAIKDLRAAMMRSWGWVPDREERWLPRS